jgi:hypothetical protein
LKYFDRTEGLSAANDRTLSEASCAALFRVPLPGSRNLRRLKLGGQAGAMFAETLAAICKAALVCKAALTNALLGMLQAAVWQNIEPLGSCSLVEKPENRDGASENRDGWPQKCLTKRFNN